MQCLHNSWIWFHINWIYHQRGTYGTNKPGGAITQLRPRVINRQRPVTWLFSSYSLYPAFVNTHCIYIYNSWNIKEFKEQSQLKKINCAHMRDYATGPSCVSVSPTVHTCMLPVLYLIDHKLIPICNQCLPNISNNTKIGSNICLHDN